MKACRYNGVGKMRKSVFGLTLHTKPLLVESGSTAGWGRWFYRNEIGCKCIRACKVDGNGRTIELQREFGVGDGYSRTGMHFRSIGILVLCSRALRYRVYRKRFVKECEEQQGCQNERTVCDTDETI